jgi:hypothetical protein
MRRPKSRAQARFFGMIAGGKIKVKGISSTKAKNATRGVKYKTLPARKGRRSGPKAHHARIR